MTVNRQQAQADHSQPAMGRLIGLVPQDEQFPIGLSALEDVAIHRTGNGLKGRAYQPSR